MNDSQKNKKIKIGWAVVVFACGLLAGILGYALLGPRTIAPAEPVAQTEQNGQQEVWTCSMHPQIRQPKPGKCPICFMDLIPVETSESHIGPRQISFSPETLKLMELQTTLVERKFVEAEVRMVGKIAYDETRVKTITAWVPGRIDRLFVDFTGTVVRKGDHMAELYSPDLLSAQTELIQAARAANDIRPDTSDLMKRTAESTLAAARKKLQLLGLTEEQIKQIEQTSQPDDHVTIYAPTGGIVIEKDATEGMYVETGMKIYTIADLSQLWVLLDAYESDMMWLRYGQQVSFEAQAFPGRTFEGKISFIDPRLDPNTQTIKIRVDVPNADQMLKPGMFVRAVVKSKIAEEGKVMAEDLVGKWICPMHPSIIKDSPATCDICGMDLVTTESLGYVPVDTQQQPPLVIPASAALVTGTRAVVYVQVPDTEKPTYEGREIVLGPRAGDYYIVRDGLAAGEVVVTNGSFKIDAALQIQAKPSMMNPEGGAPAPMHQHGDMPMPEQPPAEGTHDEHIAMSTSSITDTEQTVCPVMGGTIDKNVFTVYQGKKVYFCCPGCIEEFEKSPEKYLSKLPQFKNAQQ